MCYRPLRPLLQVSEVRGRVRIQSFTGVTGFRRDSQGHLQVVSVVEGLIRIHFSDCDSKESLFSLVYRVLSALCTKETLPKFSESSCA